jgi:hypothetical protein
MATKSLKITAVRVMNPAIIRFLEMGNESNQKGRDFI